MVRKILLLSAPITLFASQPASAVCVGDLEMHSNRITGLTIPSVTGAHGEAANKIYVDRYVASHDQDRRNGTMLSEQYHQGEWFEAQTFCNDLTSPAILPDTGAVSEQTYSDWYLPSRVEWIAACQHHGSQLNYTEQSWAAGGLCADTSDQAFWTREFHDTPTGWPHEQPWESFEVPLDKYDLLITGKAETFDPATGTSMRVNADLNHHIRCIR